jgi:CheY-like chemotaxis protein/thiamine kinase-like enzyme
MSRKGRILIVENEGRWREALTAILSQEGFQVDAVGTTAQAKECLRQGFYHFAILDIRLDDDSDSKDNEGFNLLLELKDKRLQEAMAVVVLSAFGTKEQMREAFSKHKVVDFIDKADFDDMEFTRQVQQIFANKIRANFSLEIHWPTGKGPEQQVGNLRYGGAPVKKKPELRDLLALELDDLLCRLFYQAKSLLVESMTPGYSGSSVLLATPFYEAGAGQQVVVKFGDPDLIEAEYRHFMEFVQKFISGARSTNVLDWQRITHLGGIAYSLLGSASHRLENFGSFYRRATHGQINEVLSHLFLDTCKQWYANPGRLQLHNLTEEYTRMLRLTPENLGQALHDLKSAQGGEKLRLNSLTSERSFINPVAAITGQQLIKSTYVCITHGDLNESNFLVDEAGHTWLIDFGRTGPGHILRDIAELDAAVRIELLAETEATLEERLKMEETLCQATRFSDLKHLDGRLQTQNLALSKAYSTALHLRILAHKLIEHRPGDDISDYYIALLYYALSYLRYYAMSRLQREHALLSASLLVKRLGLGTGNE